MTNQHTPGPWTVREDKDEWAIIGSEPSWVCGINRRNHSAKANARLIATAPELLAALETLADETRKVGIALSNMGQGATALGLAEHKARAAGKGAADGRQAQFAELDAVRALIDAAPALLLALEGLTEAMWGSLDSGREIPAEMSVAARAAIKAARRK